MRCSRTEGGCGAREGEARNHVAEIVAQRSSRSRPHHAPASITPSLGNVVERALQQLPLRHRRAMSSNSIPVFDDIVHVERAASMTLSRRQRAELKRGEGRCSCGLNAVRSQVAADGSCRSLPMAVADRCRWLLPMALADRCRWPLPIVADGRCRSSPLSASSQTSLCLLDAGLAGLIKSQGASLSLESYHSPSSRST